MKLDVHETTYERLCMYWHFRDEIRAKCVSLVQIMFIAYAHMLELVLLALQHPIRYLQHWAFSFKQNIQHVARNINCGWKNPHRPFDLNIKIKPIPVHRYVQIMKPSTQFIHSKKLLPYRAKIRQKYTFGETSCRTLQRQRHSNQKKSAPRTVNALSHLTVRTNVVRGKRKPWPPYLLAVQSFFSERVKCQDGVHFHSPL